MKTFDRLVGVILLALLSGVGVFNLMGALIAGQVDGPVKGFDVVSRLDSPLMFWTMTAWYALMAICCAAAGLAIAKSKDD